jgi:hypothetical protein
MPRSKTVAQFWHRTGPHPSSGGARQTRSPGRTADGTGASPGHAGTDHLDQVQLTTWSNSYAERFVLTARTEVTDRILILSERHLRTVLAEYEAHYNGRRPHRSRQLRPPRPDHPVADLSQQRIKRRPVLGGLINEYERAA